MNTTIHEQALEAAGRFRSAEADLVRILQEIESKRVFFDLGYTSLFDYCVKALRLSESVASNFVNVGRKAREIPALQKAIANQELSVSKARKITPVLTNENPEHWISLARNLSTRKLEEEVAKVLPREAVPERLKPVSENVSELKLGVSREIAQKLKRVQDLESQRNGKAVNFEETLNAVLDVYLEAKDPVKRADRILRRNQSNESYTQGEDRPKKSIDGDRIVAEVRHIVQLRDDGRCTHVTPGGQRCESRRWIDVHHIQPRSEGGDNRVSNLALLCRAHHRMEHRMA